MLIFKFLVAYHNISLFYSGLREKNLYYIFTEMLGSPFSDFVLNDGSTGVVYVLNIRWSLILLKCIRKHVLYGR